MQETREAPSAEQAARSSGGSRFAGEQRSAFASGEGITPGHRTDPERGAPSAGKIWSPAPEPPILDSATPDFPTSPPPAPPVAELDPPAPQVPASPVLHDVHGHAQAAATSAGALASGPLRDVTMGPEAVASSEVAEGRTEGPSSGKSGGLLQEPASDFKRPPVPVVPDPLAAPPSDAPRNGSEPAPALSPQPEAGPTLDEAPAALTVGLETNALSPLQGPAGAAAATVISAAPSSLPSSPGSGATGPSSQPRLPIGGIGRSVGPQSAFEPGDRADGGGPPLRAKGAAPDAQIASHARGSDESGSRQPAGDAQIGRLPPLSGAPSSAVAFAQPATGVIGELGQAVARGAEGVVTVGPGPHRASRQVALQVTRALDQGRTEIRIQLDPPELGEVDIHLEFRELRLSATVSAERADTLDLLQRDARTLARALREAGVELADSDLSFTSGGRHDRPDAGASGQRAILLAHPFAAPAPIQDRSLAAARPDGFVSLSDGRMDLRV